MTVATKALLPNRVRTLVRSLVQSPPPAYTNAMDRAYSLALRSPRRAMVAAQRALDVAVHLGRPDLTWGANNLLGTLEAL